VDVKELHERLIRSGLADENSIQGCSEYELAEIAFAARRDLPTSYREFMATFGKKAGKFMADVDMFYPGVLSLRTTADEILDDLEQQRLSLPLRAFVFGIRYKEQFVFFADSTDDPEVCHYFSGDLKFRKIADSYWDHIEAELEEAERNEKETRGKYFDF